MIRETFNDEWTAGAKAAIFGTSGKAAPGRKTVRVPYDAVRDMDRSPESPNGSHTGYFPSAHLTYQKAFFAPEEWRNKSVYVEFEGIYRDAMIFVNRDFAAQQPNGYTATQVNLSPYLRFGEVNSIRVESRTHNDSRWYGGGGIHRNCWIAVAEPVHLTLDGLRISTPDIDDERAVVVAELQIVNESRHTRTVRIHTSILGPHGDTSASASIPVTLLPGSEGTARVKHFVGSPKRWNVDDPNLYEMHVRIEEDGALLDQANERFGIRTIQVDPARGLRINDRVVKLRGGCVHHDNGPLGSAAISRAEERRVEILKSAGYNAVRSAHNSISRSFLEACDRLGMLVLDELSDVWTEGKTSFDYSLVFAEWWERDVEAMVRKDFNHPSVFMYSIGNEITEIGRPIGSIWGRRLAEKVRALDGSRLVTNAINGLLATMDLSETANDSGAPPVDVNTFIDMGEMPNSLESSKLERDRTEEAHSQLDVSGYNYSESRYEQDLDASPDRVVMGSETFPGALDRLWSLVQKHPHVIGDFAWTAWDYIGEAGLGRVVYRDSPQTLAAPYPYMLAGAGTIDITGMLRPIAFWRQTVWGLRKEPYIAVHRPQQHARESRVGMWSWPDSLSSWSWIVAPGAPITVDIYSDAEEVELLINGQSAGRSRVGRVQSFVARFEAEYEPGELTAVAFRGGKEVGRASISSADDNLSLQVTADRGQIRADDGDLAYVEVAIADSRGVVANDARDQIEVTIEGAAELAGLGTADPLSEERFDADRRSTFDGRALAIIRPTGRGRISLHVKSVSFGSASVDIFAG